MDLLQTITSGITTLSILVSSLLGFSAPQEEKIVKIPEQNFKQTVPQEVELVGAFYPTAAKTYQLQASISPTATSVRLINFKEPISNIPYTMAYLNTAIAYGTLQPENPNRSEIISFTGITQNSDGSATLTGVTRGLSRSFPFTASSTFQMPHPAQATFVLSDAPQVFTQYAAKDNDENITGVWTGPIPSLSNQFATKEYVDASITGTSTISTDKVVVAGTAGQTIASGQIVSLNVTDGRWYLTRSTVSTSTLNTIIGVAQGAATVGQTISGGVLTSGLTQNLSGLTVGRMYFASSTAGALSIATTSRAIGMARSATSLYVDPYLYNPIYDPTFANAPTSTFNNAVTFASTSATFGGLRAFDVSLKNMRVFTASGTFAVPTGVNRVWVEVIGGGGGGGAAQNGTPAIAGSSTSFSNLVIAGGGNPGEAGSPTSFGGGAGGGGGYCAGYVDVTGTTSIAITIGNAGVGGIDNSGINAAGGGGTGGTCSGLQFSTSTFLQISNNGNNGFGGGGGAFPGTTPYGLFPVNNSLSSYGLGGSGSCNVSTGCNGGNGTPGLVIVKW